MKNYIILILFIFSNAFLLNSQDVTLTNKEYKKILQEKIENENKIKQLEDKLDIAAGYHKALEDKEKEVTALQKKLLKLEQNETPSKGKMKCKDKLKAAKKELKKEKEKKKKLEEEKATTKQTIKDQKEEVSRLTKELRTANNKAGKSDEFKGKNQKFKKEITALKKENGELKNNGGNVKQLRKEIKNLKQKRDIQAQALRENKITIEDLQVRLKQYAPMQEREINNVAHEVDVVIGKNIFHLDDVALNNIEKKLNRSYKAFPSDKSLQHAKAKINTHKKLCKALTDAKEALKVKYDKSKLSPIITTLEEVAKEKMTKEAKAAAIKAKDLLANYCAKQNDTVKKIAGIDKLKSEKFRKTDFEDLKKKLVDYPYLQKEVARKVNNIKKEGSDLKKLTDCN